MKDIRDQLIDLSKAASELEDRLNRIQGHTMPLGVWTRLQDACHNSALVSLGLRDARQTYSRMCRTKRGDP